MIRGHHEVPDRGGSQVRKSVIAATALVAALVLGGCSSQSGAAAVVDGEQISTATLDRTTRELQELFGPQVQSRQVLTMFSIAPSYLEAAAENGVAKSREEARDYLANIAASQAASEGSATVDVSGFSDATFDIFRFDMAVQELGMLANSQEIGAQLQERVAGLDIDVNPRFGEFSVENNIVLPLSHDWLVQPSA
jgi:hypothetical protein